MPDANDLVQLLSQIGKTPDQARSLERRRVNKRRPSNNSRPPVDSTGVPISLADWNYDEDLMQYGPNSNPDAPGSTTDPSKRRNKQHSGRAGRRMYNGLQTIQAVGGYANDIDAIYAPSDKELCVVVDPRVGYNDAGEPNRDPAPKYSVVHRGC